MTATTLIAGAQLYTGDAQDRQGVFDILIEDGHIARIDVDVPRKGIDDVVDARHLVAMPGLVQAHVHLCQTLLRSQADELELLGFLQERVWPMEAALDADSMRASVRLGLSELLLGGTTAVLDTGSVRHTDVLFEEALRMGVRYTGGKALMDQGHGFAQVLRDTTDAALAESETLCRRWHKHDSGRLNYAFSPRFVLTCSPEVLSGCARLARAYDALLQTHVAESAEEVAQVRARHKLGYVEYLNSLNVLGPDVVLSHGVWLSSAEQQLLRTHNTSLVHCPTADLKLGSGVARIDALQKLGINIALGASSAACNNSLDGFLDMRLAALVHKAQGGPQAVTAREALHMATRGGAQAMGHKKGGILAVGMHADVVLLNLNRAHAWPSTKDLASRIVYTAKSSDVDSVFVQGKACVRKGKLVHAREALVLKHATQAVAKVRRTLGWV